MGDMMATQSKVPTPPQRQLGWCIAIQGTRQETRSLLRSLEYQCPIQRLPCRFSVHSFNFRCECDTRCRFWEVRALR